MANLLTAPDDFTNAAWVKSAAAEIVADATAAPNLTTTADKLQDDNGGGTGAVYAEQEVTVTNDTHIFSVCVLPVDAPQNMTYIGLKTADFAAGANAESTFNLSTKTVENQGGDHEFAGVPVSTQCL